MSIAESARALADVKRDSAAKQVSPSGLGPLLTVEEVAELLRVPPAWVYGRTRKRSADRIPGFRLGKDWRFREADVLAWLDRQRVGAKPNA